MHYYQFNIADYRKDTIHLTPMEHYIYRSLIDWYYLDEQPIPKITQSVMRRLGVGSELEQSVQNVLQDFFYEAPEGWRHKRIDQEITEYHSKCDTNKNNGKLGGRPKKTQSVISGNRKESETKANETLTINHKPLTNNQEPILKTTLPENSVVTTEAEYAKELRSLNVTVTSSNPTLLQLIADGFTIASLIEAVELARIHKPLPDALPINYVDRIARSPPKPQQANGRARIPTPDNFNAKDYGTEITSI